jgi:hypothetical protein
MIRHIVLWRLKASAHGHTKTENARIIKQRLESLRGVIPGIDFGKTEQSCDVALCCEFESKEALRLYQEHPAHQAAVQFIREARDERYVVDYEP